jgi:hypothetical protein
VAIVDGAGVGVGFGCGVVAQSGAVSVWRRGVKGGRRRWEGRRCLCVRTALDRLRMARASGWSRVANSLLRALRANTLVLCVRLCAVPGTRRLARCLDVVLVSNDAAKSPLLVELLPLLIPLIPLALGLVRLQLGVAPKHWCAYHGTGAAHELDEQCPRLIQGCSRSSGTPRSPDDTARCTGFSGQRDSSGGGRRGEGGGQWGRARAASAGSAWTAASQDPAGWCKH